MNKIIAYIGGTFDLLHYGHLNLFKRVRDVAHMVVVSLNTDEFAERYKGKPVMNLDERIKAVEACRYVDRVVINWGDEDSKPAIIRAKATMIVHGDDWKGEALMKQMGFDQAWLDEHGIELKYFPYTKGISSTDIKQRLNERSNSDMRTPRE